MISKKRSNASQRLRALIKANPRLQTNLIQLASNENPLGPSPRAVAAARKALKNSHRYPDDHGTALVETLSVLHKIPREIIILGDGSSELIDFAARAFLRPGKSALTSQGTFVVFPLAVHSTGARLVEIPQRNHAYDLPAIARAITPETGLVYLANPNNPTGTMFTADELESFLESIPGKIPVILDEAYFEYVERPGYSRSLDQFRRDERLLLLRTFSKVHGLAGLRIGYAIGSPRLLASLNAVRLPYNTSGVAQAAALAAIDDEAHVRQSVAANRAGLEQLTRGLAHLGHNAVPSVANFILVEFGYDTAALCACLAERGILVRHMAWMGIPQAIRVTVGTHAQNERFLRALAEEIANRNQRSPGD